MTLVSSDIYRTWNFIYSLSEYMKIYEELTEICGSVVDGV